MQFRRADLADLTYFLEIARRQSFRRASLELGVGASALSHAMRGLEERLGVRLLNRNSRSVTLTAAGEALQAAIAEPFAALERASEVLNDHRDAPRGRVRLNVPSVAADHLIAPIMGEFLRRYPEVEIEVSVSNRMIDMVGGGYDAGIRFGGTVPEDMVAQRLCADHEWIVVASPDYVRRRGAPADPGDLIDHSCVQIRIGDDRIYRWEFEKDGETIEASTPGMLTVDDSAIGLQAARDGAGLMYAWAPMVRGDIAAGRLQPVLEDWSAGGSALYAYYTSRRQVPGALRLFLDLVRELRPLGL